MYNVNKSFQNVPRGSSNNSLMYEISVKNMKLKILTLTLIMTLLFVSSAPYIYAQESEQVEEDPIDPAIMNMIKTGMDWTLLLFT